MEILAQSFPVNCINFILRPFVNQILDEQVKVMDVVSEVQLDLVATRQGQSNTG